MLTVGDPFPPFDLAAVTGWDEPTLSRVRSADLAGRWLVVFFWPMDFTSVCPTEVYGFDRAAPELSRLDTAVLGVSIDSAHVHLAWRRHHPHLRHLSIPLASDIKRELVTATGTFDRATGVALRATFVVDPGGTIRYVSVHDLGTGRNVDEVVRTVAALQSGGPTPCGWQPGDALADPTDLADSADPTSPTGSASPTATVGPAGTVGPVGSASPTGTVGPTSPAVGPTGSDTAPGLEHGAAAPTWEPARTR